MYHKYKHRDENHEIDEKVEVHQTPSRNNQPQTTKDRSQVVNFDSSDEDDDDSDDIHEDEDEDKDKDNNKQGHSFLTDKDNVKLPIFQEIEQRESDTELRDIEDEDLEDLDSVDGENDKTKVNTNQFNRYTYVDCICYGHS